MDPNYVIFTSVWVVAAPQDDFETSFVEEVLAVG